GHRRSAPILAPALALPSAEPPANRQPLARCREDFMFVSIGEEAHQGAPDWKDVARSAPGQVDAQRAAIGHRPCTVEVEDAGKHARIVVAKSVPMTAVAR